MSVVIRQEINALTADLVGVFGSVATANEKIQLDTTQYVNPTYYFEIVAKTNTSSGSLNFRLTRNGTNTHDASILFSSLTSSYTRVRSASFTPPAGQTEYNAHIDSLTSGVTADIKSTRIIVIDNPTTLTSTETQIEIGMNKTGLTSTTATKVVPDTTLTKYWKYTAANWDGTKTFYAEVTYLMASSKSSGTFVLQEDNGSFASWTDLVTIVNAGIASVATRVRSASFTPTDGRNYRIAYLVASSKSAASIFNAKIIVDQSRTIADSIVPANDSHNVAINGVGGTTEKAGQSFTTTSAYTLYGVGFRILKSNSPTDNLLVDIVSTSISGTVLATSGAVPGTSLVSGTNWIDFAFSSPPSLSNATKYYLVLYRDGSRDTINRYFATDDTGSIYANGGEYTLGSGVWSSESATTDMAIRTYSAAFPTLLEPQYLQLNTADDNTTNKQNYMTLWDSTEWSGVTNTYKHAMDSDNASNSADLVDIDNSSTTVTNSGVTGANQQISSAITMPTTGHQIDTDMDNTTGVVAASRILVALTVQTVAFIAKPPIIVSQAIKRASFY